MLKIRAPIKTVSNPDFLDSQEAFCERITANYMQIGQYINEADLLHVVTEPPEIFIMDGGMTSLFSSTNVENTQIAKTQVINNLINRILISADAGLSYQDNVYITNILHKLGVRDEKTFLREVMRLTKESREQHEAVQLYWEHLEELREMVYEYSAEGGGENRSETVQQMQPVLHLHEEVNRRLQTAAIYRIIKNFYDNSSSPRNITNESFRIAEQGRMSREMLLTRLREEVRQEPAYLTYRHNNIYEGDEITDNEVTVEEISSRVTSAVLLSVIDNIYDSSYDRIDHHMHNWLSTESAYYGAAENTLFRIEQNTAYLQYLYEQTLNFGDERSEYQEEISILNRLIGMYQDLDVRVQQSYGGSRYDTELTLLQRMGDVTEVTDLTDRSAMQRIHIAREGDTIKVSSTDGQSYESRKRDEDLSQSEYINRQETNLNIDQRNGDVIEVINVSGHSSVELTHIAREGDVIEAVSASGQAYESGNEDERLPQSEYINRQETNLNIDQRRGDVIDVTDISEYSSAKMTHISREGDVTEVTQQGGQEDITKAQEQLFPPSASVSRQEMNVAISQQAGDVTDVTNVTNYSSAEMSHITRRGDVTETTEVTEHRDAFTEQVIAAYQQNIVRNQKYMRNLKSIIEQNAEQPSGETKAQRMMRESRLSLEHPEEFMREFREDERRAGERQETIRAEFERILSPQQQVAHNLIRQYLMAPERFYHSNIISADNMGLMLLDIQETEHEAFLAAQDGSMPGGEGSAEGAGSGSTADMPPVYPPSSDTTVRNPYITTVGQFPAEAAEAFRNIALSYIYPVYGETVLSGEKRSSVEAVAAQVRQQAETNIQNPDSTETEAETVYAPERRIETERSVERIFTDIREQMAGQPGEKILLHRDGEIVSAITERVVERWTERRERMPEPEVVYHDQQMSMIHRNRENVIDEEVIENLQQQIRRIDETSQSTQQKVLNHMTDQTTVVNHVQNQTIEQNSEVITKMVNRSMRRQIDEISDKVYHKIERQLKNEQRRRGL